MFRRLSLGIGDILLEELRLENHSVYKNCRGIQRTVKYHFMITLSMIESDIGKQETRLLQAMSANTDLAAV